MTLTAFDKYGHPVKKGDVVHAVHFGDNHEFTVEHISEEHGLHFLHGSVTIRVPAGGTLRASAHGSEGTPHPIGDEDKLKTHVAVREELPAHQPAHHAGHRPEGHPEDTRAAAEAHKAHGAPQSASTPAPVPSSPSTPRSTPRGYPPTKK